jgi:hypothetical protein
VNGLLTFASLIVVLYGNKMSYNLRVTGGFSIIACLILCLPFVANAYGGKDLDHKGFGICMAILLVFGVFSGILQATVFGMAGMLPPKNIGGVMLGNGLSGITTNVL